MSTEQMNVDDAISILQSHRNCLSEYCKDAIERAAETVRAAYNAEWCQDTKGNWYLSLRLKPEISD